MISYLCWSYLSAILLGSAWMLSSCYLLLHHSPSTVISLATPARQINSITSWVLWLWSLPFPSLHAAEFWQAVCLKFGHQISPLLHIIFTKTFPHTHILFQLYFKVQLSEINECHKKITEERTNINFDFECVIYCIAYCRMF